MPKTYHQCGDPVRARVNAMVKKWHPDLVKAKPTIDLLFLKSDKEGTALMHSGYPAAAVVRAISAKNRVAGRGDAEIVFDYAEWCTLSEAEQDALVDHELYHLVLVKDGAGWKKDGQGRPLFKLRKHDYQFGWFNEIARRHGEASGEVQQARSFQNAVGQLYLDFDPAEKPEAKTDAKTALRLLPANEA